MKVKILPAETTYLELTDWNAVASWTWDVQDEACGICRKKYDANCPTCKFPGDDCTLVWGACNHVFHLHCILRWVHSRQICPMCRSQWQFKL